MYCSHVNRKVRGLSLTITMSSKPLDYLWTSVQGARWHFLVCKYVYKLCRWHKWRHRLRCDFVWCCDLPPIIISKAVIIIMPEIVRLPLVLFVATKQMAFQENSWYFVSSWDPFDSVLYQSLVKTKQESTIPSMALQTLRWNFFQHWFVWPFFALFL